MFVGCWDCGKPTKGKSFDRPRSSKSGMKNTVSVCERCLVLWYIKQALKAGKGCFKGVKGSAAQQELKALKMAKKYLEDSNE